MIIIDNVYISDDIAENFFICDLEKCKGACCVEGNLGAPLEEEELEILKRNFEGIKPFLTAEGLAAIEKQGLFVEEESGDFSTPTIEGRECVYALYDERGILKCGIEKAYQEGKSDFLKPISCHLYPIRISEFVNFTAVNYHKWNICDAACVLGKRNGIEIYKFLKTALIRKFGESWYAALEKEIENRD